MQCHIVVSMLFNLNAKKRYHVLVLSVYTCISVIANILLNIKDHLMSSLTVSNWTYPLVVENMSVTNSEQ